MPHRPSSDRSGIVTPDQIPTHAEALRIIDAHTGRWRLVVLLMFGCGLRIGEALALTPAQVKMPLRGTRRQAPTTLRIDAQRARRGRVDPKTWRGIRTIEVPDLVDLELRRAMHKHRDIHVPFVVGPQGGTARPDHFYYSAWWPTLEALGIAERYVPHSGRHYCISSMLARGVPITEVAAYAGDSVATISRTYAHFLRDEVTTARGALNDSLGPELNEIDEDDEAIDGDGQ